MGARLHPRRRPRPLGGRASESIPVETTAAMRTRRHVRWRKETRLSSFGVCCRRPYAWRKSETHTLGRKPVCKKGNGRRKDIFHDNYCAILHVDLAPRSRGPVQLVVARQRDAFRFGRACGAKDVAVLTRGRSYPPDILSARAATDSPTRARSRSARLHGAPTRDRRRRRSVRRARGSTAHYSKRAAAAVALSGEPRRDAWGAVQYVSARIGHRGAALWAAGVCAVCGERR